MGRWLVAGGFEGPGALAGRHRDSLRFGLEPAERQAGAIEILRWRVSLREGF